MRRRTWLVGGLAVLLVAAGAAVVASRVSLSALEEPGEFETWAATRAKQWLIGRDAKRTAAVVPAGPQAAAIGGMRFIGQCAACHGIDGRTPTEIGRGLYPRAVDLGAPAVQSWSDEELFWIIKNGVRMTGMPGFGAALADEEIGALVAYVRTLGQASGPAQ